MKAEFVSTEGDYLQAELNIDGQTLYVMDEFGGDCLKPGQEIDVELMNSCADDLDWDAVFSANLEKRTALQHISGWSYFALGRVTSINPLMCDCGVVELEGPFSTNDTRCIGEYVGFRVTRLTAFET
ncbi:hypothetical protein EZV61_00005 [Corallincola luteus]|uniref:Uncharacterized protein n=1 Tax=Corallincola luteus TaxID=1775177 RepID=A0ABY2AN03_9GAMM|nr:hypothetical protein [Corallincola luteus]TCI04397.1 hypothetical protein EZV61_00005 [Corallincola luteus]